MIRDIKFIQKIIDEAWLHGYNSNDEDEKKYRSVTQKELGDKFYNWHISEQKKLLERVEKEVTGEIKIIEPPKEVEKFKEKRQAFMAGEMNILMRLHDKFQSLNKLKEEK